MEIINLTPHDINIYDKDGNEIALVPRSMKLARLDSSKELVKIEDGINFYQTKYGIPYLAKIDEKGKELERIQLPEMEESVIYIVSGLFRAGYPRKDFWQPGDLIRDEEGQPIGCLGLSQ